MSSERATQGTVIFARLGQPLAGAVFGVVQDWSAVGLLTQSIWVDVDQDRPRVQAIVVEQGRATRVDMSSWLADRGRLDLRIVVAQVTGGEQPGILPEEAQRLARRIGLGQMALVNVIVPADDASALPEDIVFPAMSNVLVQPVDGRDAAAPADPLGKDRSVFVMHAATALAVVGALWTDMAEAPLEGLQPAAGSFVSVGRAYVRLLDASAVLLGLAEQTFSSPGQLPHPRTREGDELGAVDPGSAQPTVEAAAEQLLHAHAHLTQFRPPAAFVSPPPERLSLLKTIGMFLSFVGAALLRAPREWTEGLVDRVAGKVAGASTRYFFGSESGYEVVVNGVARSRGARPDTVDDLTAAVRSLLSARSPGSQQPAPDARPLWIGLARTAACLADGGNAPGSVAMPTSGRQRLVIDDPRLLAPAPDARSFLPPNGLLAELDSLEISPHDPYLALRAHGLLSRELAPERLQAHPPGRIDQLNRTLTQLTEWVGSRRSLTWRAGIGIAQQLDLARAALSEAVGVQDTASEAQRLAEVVAEQRKVRRLVWTLLAALVALVLAVVVIVVLGVIGILIGIGIGVVVVLLWLVISTKVFIGAQRKLFHLIHQRQELLERIRWAEQSLQHLTGEVLRLAAVYRQSRLWSVVLGRLVHDPFGGAGDPEPAPEYPVTVGGELPLAVRVGHALFDPQVQHQLVFEARCRMLEVGWLNRQLDTRFEAALRPRSQRYGRLEHEGVWADDASSPGGPLADLAARLGQRDDRHAAREQATASLVAWLQHEERTHGTAWSLPRMLPTVATDGARGELRLTGEEFLDPLKRGIGHLDVSGFSAVGVSRTANAVAVTSVAASGVDLPAGTRALRTVRPSGNDGLDRLIVRMDFTAAVTPENLSYFEVATDEDDGEFDPSRLGEF